MLATLIGAGAWLFVRPAHYTATAQVLVTPTPYYDRTYLGLGGVVRDTPGDPFRAVETAATMLDSHSAAAAAAKRLGPGWSADRVRASATVRPMGGTNVLAVQASASRAATATTLANAFAAAALADRRRILRTQALELIGVLRGTPHVPTTRITTLRAVGGGVDPTLSLLHPAGGHASATGLGVRQTLTVALFAGLILGTAFALLGERLSARRSSRPSAAGSSTVSPLPSVGAQAGGKLRGRDDLPP